MFNSRGYLSYDIYYIFLTPIVLVNSVCSQSNYSNNPGLYDYTLGLPTYIHKSFHRFVIHDFCALVAVKYSTVLCFMLVIIKHQ